MVENLEEKRTVVESVGDTPLLKNIWGQLKFSRNEEASHRALFLWMFILVLSLGLCGLFLASLSSFSLPAAEAEVSAAMLSSSVLAQGLALETEKVAVFDREKKDLLQILRRYSAPVATGTLEPERFLALLSELNRFHGELPERVQGDFRFVRFRLDQEQKKGSFHLAGDLFFPPLTPFGRQALSPGEKPIPDLFGEARGRE